VVLALVVVPAGWGRSPNACALLSNVEVARAFGASVAMRQPDDLDRTCTWSGALLGSFTSARSQLTLSVARGVTKAKFVAGYAVYFVAGAQPGTMRRALSSPVRGVGEVAFSMFNGEELAVWHSGWVVDISTSVVSSSLRTEVRLAKAVLGRLR
jgi:hypothetical protein